MSKKMMLLALAVASAALFALPAFASAQEIHFEGPTTFTGEGGAGSLVAEEEPTITCEKTDVTNGTISAGGTTGNMTLDFTGCHTTIFGFTAKCHTSGSPADNTIASGGTFHLITWKNTAGTSFPAVLVTTITTNIICAGISNTHVPASGIIGTITSPGCGGETKELKLSFTATGSTQNHIEYTGTKYDLSVTTEGQAFDRTAGLNASATLTANALGKLNCT